MPHEPSCPSTRGEIAWHECGTAGVGGWRGRQLQAEAMSGPLTAASETTQVTSVVPILRMYDVAATIRFYVDYLGCSLD